MLPTILEGDRIFVNKLAYNLRIPFDTYEIAKLDDLHRGDIFVFLFPDDERTDYVKRLVGLPGDTIEIKDDLLYINGEVQRRRPARPSELPPGVELEQGKQIFIEDLQGVQHLVYERSTGERTNFGPHLVDSDKVFAMGDNRDNSSDSRVWGGVPLRLIKGRALRVVLSVERRGPCGGQPVKCYLGLLDPRRFRMERAFLSLYDDFATQ